MTDGFKIQVNVKIGDTLVNLRGDSPAEVESYLSWAEQNATTIHTTIAALQAQSTVAAAFPGATNVPAPHVPAPPGPPWSQPQQAPAPAFAPQQQAVPQGGAPGPSCAHGPMTHRSGNKNGKTWSAHFCSAPKGDPNQCDPVWGR